MKVDECLEGNKESLVLVVLFLSECCSFLYCLSLLISVSMLFVSS